MNASGRSSPTHDRMKVRILLVDDDEICLAITASVLQLFNYEVVTMSCPLEALSTVRMNQESFDIILSDVHMPLMNGLTFQTIIEADFKIPLILMSVDDKKNVLLQSLQNEVVFFIIKPPSINDLKNIWQYVVSRRNGPRDGEPGNGIMVVNRQLPLYANNDPLANNVERAENNAAGRNNTRRPKFVWTTALHNKFLEAIIVIGANRAVPKMILEYMNIRGLTRENIASHLQQHRILMKRLNESNGAMQHGMPINWNERTFQSSLSWSQFPSLANNCFLLKYSNAINHNNPSQGPTSMQMYTGANYANNNLNLFRPNILESSMVGEDASITAARQFLTPKFNPSANNIERNHHMRPYMMSINGNNIVRGSNQLYLSGQERNYLDSGFGHVGSSMNVSAPLLASMNITATAGLNTVNISATAELDNSSSVSGGQVNAENNMNARDQDMSSLNLIGESSVPLQDWTPNQFDDYFRVEYGIEDLSSIISNNREQNENNNN